MFYRYHSKSPWLKKVLIPFWVFQLSFMLGVMLVFVWLRGDGQVVLFVILSIICSVLAAAEIILFAGSWLHPLTYLILQLCKTIIWMALLILAGVNSIYENISGYLFLQWFAEPLILFLTFLGTLIYASVVYHRHRRAKSRFRRSMQGKDLFPVITDEIADPANSHRILRAPRNSIKEMGSGPGTEAARAKEAVEVTVLRELGGDWEVHELPATRSVRSSRGAKSVRSFKGGR